MRWLSLLFAVGLLRPVPATTTADETLRRAVELGYAQQYERAWSELARIPDHDSLAPLSGFWQAALLQMLLYDSGDPALADSFHRVSDQALTACRARLSGHPDDAQAHLFLGLTQLNRANCLGWQRRRLRAVLALNSAARSLRRAAQLDSTLPDAWFGLAVVEYFRGTADRYALGLGLFGSRDEAYRLMERARAGDGRLLPAAEFALAWMHKEDGEYADAVALSRQLLQRYPGNRSGLRLLRDSHLAAGQWQEVLAVSRRLESSVIGSFPGNRYGLAENRLAMLKAWKGLGVRDSALACAEQLISWSPYEKTVPWLPQYIAEARRLQARLEP